jgi:hypothetical protein
MSLALHIAALHSVLEGKAAPKVPKAPKAATNSRGVRWDTDTEEHFELMGHAWDIRAAKQILAAKPRKLVQLPVANLATMSVSTQAADGTPDTTIPVILGTLKSGSNLPLDGWHRIRMAHAAGLETIPAVILTKAETAKIEV